MTLVLRELPFPAGEAFWLPFTYEEAGRGFTHGWWYGRPVYPNSSRRFLHAYLDGDEVARVELDERVSIDHYADVPDIEAMALEIQFIEVHAEHRLAGIGHAVVELLANQNPDRRLVAFSDGADGFWASLGWRRHLHADPDEARYYRPLFIAPA